MQVPSGFTTGLLIESAAEGRIAVGFAKDGVLMGDFTLSPLDVANMAAALLAASKDGADKLPARDGETQDSGALVLPSSFSLGPGMMPGQEALILSFGQSHLAFSMPQATMQSLGESMVMLATRNRAQ
ncbi:hypothetical protein [Cognatiluteimonas weifangensis]|uniref:hypothetical protein n=1 Tax=Cognatiluteimonas weifangensis TaxID=2303539 RepID=UPI0011C158CD|nr:hypothetical protein [Luteimonas weifangensis]